MTEYSLVVTKTPHRHETGVLLRHRKTHNTGWARTRNTGEPIWAYHRAWRKLRIAGRVNERNWNAGNILAPFKWQVMRTGKLSDILPKDDADQLPLFAEGS